VLARDIAPEDVIVPSGVPLLDVLPADASLRALDAVFAGIDKKKRLMRLAGDLARQYDHVFLDCPPGLGDASEQVIRGADLIVLPMIPSLLSHRAYAEVRDHLDRHHKGKPTIFPVFNMVDRRRSAHVAALKADPGYPVIPNASTVEEMAQRHAAVGLYAPRSPAALAVAKLWTMVERKLVPA
jgi:chromosome partitioning protein